MLNKISEAGLKQFDKKQYEIGEHIKEPDAIIVRSADMHKMVIPDSVKIIARAGAGTNNIPVASLTKRGIPVINSPGANANAVMELVIAGMLLASRHICAAWNYVQQLSVDKNTFNEAIEKNKKQFVGFELTGKTLGVIGLGNVGVKVANAALGLGMKVIGYDPALSVNKAWELSPYVERANDLNLLLAKSDFVSLHVPLVEATRTMINKKYFAMMKKGIVLLNFSRSEIVEMNDLLLALNDNQLSAYVSDFPCVELQQHSKVIFLPHIGASTVEAEENCAVLIVEHLQEYFENGAIIDSVNFPTVEPTQPSSGSRITVSNKNVPSMVAQITTKLAQHKLNIIYFLSKSKEEVAYNIIDVDRFVDDALLADIAKVAGIIQVRRVT